MVDKQFFLDNVNFLWADDDQEEEKACWERCKDKMLAYVGGGDPVFVVPTEVLGYKTADVLGCSAISKTTAEMMRKDGFRFVLSSMPGDGIYSCKKNSSFSKSRYRFLDYDDIYALNEADVFVIRDAYEAEVFPALDENKVFYRVCSGPTMAKMLMPSTEGINRRTWNKENGMHSYPGMHYFNNDFEHMGERVSYLLACQNKSVLGVICYGYWGAGPFSMSYIDVAQPYQGKGLATALIKKFADIVKDEKKIYITDESEKGKECHMLDIFKKYLTIPIITS